jgi:conjugal transfer/entry exclusion protein
MDAIVAKLKSQRAALVTDLGRIDAALAALTGVKAPAKTAAVKKTKRRKRRKMTAAEKRAVSERMKKSWADRKKKASRR